MPDAPRLNKVCAGILQPMPNNLPEGSIVLGLCATGQRPVPAILADDLPCGHAAHPRLLPPNVLRRQKSTPSGQKAYAYSAHREGSYKRVSRLLLVK